jgi:hypothetical protein
MKLYEVRRGCLIKVLPELKERDIETGESAFEDVHVPVASAPVHVNQYLHFSHVDGMYSVCHTMDGELVHIAAWTEVEIVENTYENHALIREIEKRGGRGKDGLQNLKWVKLSEMSDSWVENCVTYNEARGLNTTSYVNELRYRKEHKISIPDSDE